MTIRWRIAVVALAACMTVGASGARAAGAISAVELKALADHLKTDAAAWAKDELGDREVRATAIRLKKATYDATSATALIQYVRSITSRSTAEDLYVVNRLLRPLLMAKSDAIGKTLPTIKIANRGAVRYKPIPEYLRKVDKKKAIMTSTSSQRMTPDMVVAAIAATQRGASEKYEKLQALKRWNEEVHMFKMAVYELLIFAEDGRADTELMMLLQAGEAQGMYAFLDICEIVKKHVRTLDRKRAVVYQKGFASLGARLRVKKGDYAKYYEYRQAGDKLVPVTQSDYPGIRLLQTANLLAPVAGKSALVVPTPKQIEEYLKKRR